MEVLLLQDVASVGKKNDLIIVGSGFALNYLLPRRIALVATPIVRKRYAEDIRKRAENREQEKAYQEGIANLLKGKNLTFKRKTTKTGKLYAAISERMISDALREQLHIDSPVESISIPTPIKAVGAFTVEVKMGENRAQCSVIVEAEKV